jgi:hypothetical protein
LAFCFLSEEGGDDCCPINGNSMRAELSTQAEIIRNLRMILFFPKTQFYSAKRVRGMGLSLRTSLAAGSSA